MLRILTLSIIFSCMSAPKPSWWPSADASVSTKHNREITCSKIEEQSNLKVSFKLESESILFEFEEEGLDIDILVLSLMGEFKKVQNSNGTITAILDLTELEQGSYFINILNRNDRLQKTTYRLKISN